MHVCENILVYYMYIYTHIYIYMISTNMHTWTRFMHFTSCASWVYLFMLISLHLYLYIYTHTYTHYSMKKLESRGHEVHVLKLRATEVKGQRFYKRSRHFMIMSCTCEGATGIQ
jgi:hypothetical protein